ncbi:MAG: hypothetical protein AAFQ94_14215 [Bacteroidota bacterium]
MKISVTSTFRSLLFFLAVILLSMANTIDTKSEKKNIANTNDAEYMNSRNLHDAAEFKELPEEIINKRLKRLRIRGLS